MRHVPIDMKVAQAPLSSMKKLVTELLIEAMIPAMLLQRCLTLSLSDCPNDGEYVYSIEVARHLQESQTDSCSGCEHFRRIQVKDLSFEVVSSRRIRAVLTQIWLLTVTSSEELQWQQETQHAALAVCYFATYEHGRSSE